MNLIENKGGYIYFEKRLLVMYGYICVCNEHSGLAGLCGAIWLLGHLSKQARLL